MSRFFISPESINLNSGSITVTGEDVRHIGNVLRAIPGDVLVLSDGLGMDYEAVIEHIGKDVILTRITGSRPNRTEPPIGLTLFQGLPKADKMEYIIQKCIELGVKRIVPVMTARSVVKFSNAKDSAAKTVRWRRIALEAAKQCDRGIVPIVEEPVRLEKALEMSSDCGLKLIPYEEESKGSLKELLRQYGSNSGDSKISTECSPSRAINVHVGILIGPEGGFEPDEVERAARSGFSPVTLGPRILRTETAGMAVASIIMHEIGDMSK